MIRTVHVLLTLTLTLALASCGGGYGPAEFVTDYGKAICDKDFTCCSATDLAGKTRSECEQSYTGFMASAYESEVKAAESKGRLVFHADKAKACVTALKQATCASWPQAYSEAEACVTQAIEPKVAIGGKCDMSGECIDGWCSGAVTDDNGNTTDGTCAAFVGLGGTCTTDQDCVNTAYCNSTCTERKSLGAACFLDSECTTQNCASSSTGSGGSQCAAMKCYQGCTVGGPIGATGTFMALALLTLAALRRRCAVRRR